MRRRFSGEKAPAWQRRRGLPFVVALAAVCAQQTARAEEPTVNFNVPSKPLKAALTDLALQADVSVGFGDLSACAGQGHAVVGRFTVERGLRILLEGTGCAFSRLDKRAFSVATAARGSAVRRTASANPNPRADVSELIVVATRQSTPADRLAYSVESVSGTVLAQQGIRDINDLSLLDPSIYTTNLGMGRDKILLRGISDGPLTGLTQSLAGLYLDDARMTFNAPDPALRLTDIERVEVLRGPQGALYGAGSLSGIVQLVSAEPDNRRFSGFLAATGSTTKGGGPSDSFDAVVNAPILSGAGAVRLVLYHEEDGGYIDDSVLGIKNANDSRRNGGRVVVKLDLSPRWTMSLGVVGQDIAASDTQYETLGSARYSRAPEIREPHDNNFRQYHVSVAGDLGWAQSHTSIEFVDQTLLTRYDASQAPPVGGAPGPTAFDDHEQLDSVVLEHTLASSSAARVQWLAGLTYAHSWQATHLTLTDLAVPSVAFDEKREDVRDDAALFGQATIPLYAEFTLTVGGRLFTMRDHADSKSAYFGGLLSVPFAGAVGQTGFAPKVVLADRLWKPLLVYVQIDEGYRGPGINTASAPNERFEATGEGEPQRFYKGDSLWSLEAGAKLTTLGGHLRLEAAGFDVKWRSVQSDQLLPSGLPYTANVGDGRNLGFEFDASYRTGALELRADALFNHPKLYAANTAFPLLEGAGLSDVAPQALGASAHYAWSLGDRRSLQLDGRWAYVGGSHLMLNVASLPRMGDYSTGRLAASYVTDRWRLTLAVDNPADSSGNTFAYGNPFTVRQANQVTPLRPRTVTLGAAAAF